MGRELEPFSQVYLLVSIQYNQWLLLDIDCLTEIFLEVATMTWQIFHIPNKLLETIIPKKTWKNVLEVIFSFLWLDDTFLMTMQHLYKGTNKVLVISPSSSLFSEHRRSMLGQIYYLYWVQRLLLQTES